MTPVFSAPDLTRVSFARNLLEGAEIPCVIQNELTRTVGPSIYGYSHNLLDPVLCVLDDSHVAAAKEILAAQLDSTEEAGPDWPCPDCNESNPAAFDLCWNCGAVRP